MPKIKPTPRKCETCGSREWPDVLGAAKTEEAVREECATLMADAALEQVHGEAHGNPGLLACADGGFDLVVAALDGQGDEHLVYRVTLENLGEVLEMAEVGQVQALKEVLTVVATVYRGPLPVEKADDQDGAGTNLVELIQVRARATVSSHEENGELFTNHPERRSASAAEPDDGDRHV